MENGGLWFVIGMIAGGCVACYAFALGSKAAMRSMILMLDMSAEDFRRCTEKLEQLAPKNKTFSERVHEEMQKNSAASPRPGEKEL